MAGIVPLIRGNRLEWRAEVTAGELAKVAPGQAVTVTMPTGAAVNGKVRVVAPTVDTTSRNAIVYVDLAKHAEARAGMFARQIRRQGATALSLPQQAVVLRDGFSYVFKLEAGNKVTQLKVQTGRRVGDRVEITAGPSRWARKWWRVEPPSWPKVTSFGGGGDNRQCACVQRARQSAGDRQKQGPEHDECLLMVDQKPIPSVMIFFLLTLAGLFSFSAMKVQNFPTSICPR